MTIIINSDGKLVPIPTTLDEKLASLGMHTVIELRDKLRREYQEGS